jgi:hypothetical protein
MATSLTLNALNAVHDLNSVIELVNANNFTVSNGTGSITDGNAQVNLIAPEVFYSKQLLDTIRIDAAEYKYYRIADESPIQNKADKLVLRRWAPLQAHTVPLEEGVPPKSDKGSVKKYELTAYPYGRFMEFTDQVDWKAVDPVIAHYSREYSIVAIETLDLLAREALLALANPWYAGSVAGFESLLVTSKPTMLDFRLIALNLKRQMVKPRGNGRYLVTAGPEFYFDMLTDATVEKYMTINNTTKDMYDGSILFPMFGFDFQETLVCPTSGDFTDLVVTTPTPAKRIYRDNSGTPEYATIYRDTPIDEEVGTTATVCTIADGYAIAELTGKEASYIPDMEVWDIDNLAYDGHADWSELKVQHVIIVGKEALTRTGLTGEGQAKMYVKPLGSAGVLDPIDQRQSIGFKINSVGFGSTRPEAIIDYMCVPSQCNI